MSVISKMSFVAMIAVLPQIAFANTQDHQIDDGAELATGTIENAYNIPIKIKSELNGKCWGEIDIIYGGTPRTFIGTIDCAKAPHYILKPSPNGDGKSVIASTVVYPGLPESCLGTMFLVGYPGQPPPEDHVVLNSLCMGEWFTDFIFDVNNGTISASGHGGAIAPISAEGNKSGIGSGLITVGTPIKPISSSNYQWRVIKETCTTQQFFP